MPPDNLQNLSLNELLLMQEVHNSDGITIGQIKRSGRLSLARSSLFKLADKLTHGGWISKKVVPNSNLAMPPTYVFYASDSVTLEQIQSVISLKSDNARVDRVQDNSINQAKPALASIKDLIGNINPKFQQAHLEILYYIASKASVTARELLRESSASMQTIHSRLIKLMKLGLITREKQQTPERAEFFYSLAPSINKSDVLQLAKEANIQNLSLVNLQLENGTHKSFKIQQLDLPLQNSIGHNETEIKLLLAKFPTCNPTWSEPLQEKWLEMYDRLIKIVERGKQ